MFLTDVWLVELGVSILKYRYIGYYPDIENIDITCKVSIWWVFSMKIKNFCYSTINNTELEKKCGQKNIKHLELDLVAFRQLERSSSSDLLIISTK